MTSWIDVAGWTLLHFLWQGAAIAVATGALLHLLRNSSPQARYAVACAALALMLAAPIGTALTLTGSPRSAIADSVHLLRSSQGNLVGVAFTPPSVPGPSASTPTVPTPTELTFPIELNTQTLFSTLVALWLAGVGILLARLAAGCWRVRRLHAVARGEAMSRWQSVAEDLASRLDLRRRFSIVDSARVATPTVVGWLHPIVMLPIAALSGLTPRQVEAILAHELAHIRRHDFIVNLLQTLAETALFYHPAVWWISARIRAEREHCCDDVAVAVCGDAREYAAALTELASWSLANPPLVMAATRGPLLDRIRRLLHVQPSDRRPRRTTIAAAVVLTCAVAGAFGAMLKAQPLARTEGVRLGPAGVNELLGFELFPGPVQLPGADPVRARAWHVTVGSAGNELAMMGFSARSLIRQAYELERTPVVGGPAWIDQEAFNLTAPADLTIVDGLTDAAEVGAALRQLMEGQLGLITHRETRTFPAYALVLASADGRLGPSLKPSTIDCFAAGPNARPDRAASDVGPTLHRREELRRLCGIDNNFFGLSGARVTMAELAQDFHRSRYPLAPNREIVDRTGLTGAYDFELRFGAVPLAAIGQNNYHIGRLLQPFGIRSLFSALPEQLGLKLIDSTISRDVLVIDQINRPQ